MDCIVKTEQGFLIRKKYKGKYYDYGVFDDLSSAQKVRDTLISVDWGFKDYCMRFITYVQRDKKYIIQKSIKGRRKTFGYYSDLKEAQMVRDELESNNWMD